MAEQIVSLRAEDRRTEITGPERGLRERLDSEAVS